MESGCSCLEIKHLFGTSIPKQLRSQHKSISIDYAGTSLCWLMGNSTFKLRLTCWRAARLKRSAEALPAGAERNGETVARRSGISTSLTGGDARLL